MAAAAALSIVVATAQAGEPPPEPTGYKFDDFRSPTPATLSGAKVVDDDEAFAIWKARSAVFVDVMPRAPKPPNLPPGTIWRDKPRANIPGSIWLPNVGYGALSPEMDGYFRRNLEQATGGDKAKPLLVYCLKDCWMSWNAAKRALEYGYTTVIWYPQGTDGWAEFNNPIEPAEPRP